MTPTAQTLLALLDHGLSRDDVDSLTDADRRRLTSLLHHWHSLASQATPTPETDNGPQRPEP